MHSSNVKADLVRLWKITAMRVRNALARVTEQNRNEVEQVSFLRSRRCRNDQFREFS